MRPQICISRRFETTDMDISLRIVIPSSLLLFVHFLVDLGEGHNSCPELRCGHHGPGIRFPFRLKDRQPDQQCGYPGFDLYCSHNNDTVLELPTSVKTFVNSIDYESQLINVTVSDACSSRGIPVLNISSSPFQFRNYLYDYALFNCTRTRETDAEHYRRIDCLSRSGYPVYAFDPDDDIQDLPVLLCKKMYNVSSVPSDIWSSSLQLTWSEPKCGACEVKGDICRFKNNTKIFETEGCHLPPKAPNKYKDNKGIVFYPISTSIITQVLHVSSQHILI